MNKKNFSAHRNFIIINEPIVFFVKTFPKACFPSLKSEPRLCPSLPHGLLFVKIIININVAVGVRRKGQGWSMALP